MRRTLTKLAPTLRQRKTPKLSLMTEGHQRQQISNPSNFYPKLGSSNPKLWVFEPQRLGLEVEALGLEAEAWGLEAEAWSLEAKAWGRFTQIWDCDILR